MMLRRLPASLFLVGALALGALTVTAGPVAAQDSSGTVALIGPTLVAVGIDGQVLIADVSNSGDAEASYRVELDRWQSAPVEVTVAAGTTSRIELPLSSIQPSDAAVPVVASLFEGTQSLGTSALDIQVVDLRDPADREQATEAIEDLQADPEVDAEVVEALDETIEPALADDAEVTTTAAEDEDESSFPIVWVVVGAAVVLVVVGIAVASRRKR